MSSDTVRRCDFCNMEVILPNHCSYCGMYFCDKHRLPENHTCLKLPSRDWNIRKRMLSERRYRKPISATLRKGKSNLSIDISDPVKDDVRLIKKSERNRKKRTKSKKHRKLRILIKILFVSLLICGGFVAAWKMEVFSEEINQKFDSIGVYLSNTVNTIMNMSIKVNMSIREMSNTVIIYLQDVWASYTDPFVSGDPPESYIPFRSVDDLVNFLDNDNVSVVVHVSDFKCGDFAEALVIRAHNAGYDLKVYSMFGSELDDFIQYVESLEYVEVKDDVTITTLFVYDQGAGHAICKTEIDSVLYLIEPQNDMVFEVIEDGYDIVYFGEVTTSE